MSLFRNAEKRFYAPPSGSGDPWAIPSNGSLSGVTPSGVQVTDETAMQLIAVMACVRILAGSVSGLPLDAVRADSDGVKTPLTPAPGIIADPFGGAANSRYPTRREGMRQAVVSLLLRGNAYLLVTLRDSRMRPLRLRVLHPDRVKCVFNDVGQRTYTIDRTEVDAEDIVHLIGMSFPESPTGMSVISYARNSIGLGLAAESFGAQFFGKGAHMTGIITVPGDLDKERARAMKESFEASHSGLKNAHSAGILSGGADWKPISVSPEDAQFLGTRAAQNLDMAMLFGVPPHMLGQTDKTTSWGTGIEQQTMGFLTFTLEDWLGPFEDAWSAMLPAPQTASFNRNALLRTDEAGRYAVYSAARAAGILTQNEIRARENYPPIDGGDDIAAGLNSTASPTKDIGAKTSMTADQLGTVL
jgi:HK97 family phage portal protein